MNALQYPVQLYVHWAVDNGLRPRYASGTTHGIALLYYIMFNLHGQYATALHSGTDRHTYYLIVSWRTERYTVQ